MVLNMSSILTWILVGAVAGFSAEWLIGDVRTGCISTIIIGIAGALVGGWLFDYFGVSIGLTGIWNDIVTALVGSGGLLLVIKFMRQT